MPNTNTRPVMLLGGTHHGRLIDIELQLDVIHMPDRPSYGIDEPLKEARWGDSVPILDYVREDYIISIDREPLRVAVLKGLSRKAAQGYLDAFMNWAGIKAVSGSPAHAS